ncbi:MAG: carboxypeptidase regulatory-like domain-containing protein [Fibrobacterota bacterium]
MKKFICLLAVLAAFSTGFTQGGTADTTGVIVGTVYDSLTQDPVENAMVVLSLYLLNPKIIDTAFTDADGAFAFDSLVTGRRNAYNLSVSADSFAAALKTNITLTAGQTDTVDIALLPPDSTPPAILPMGAFTGTIQDSLTGGVLNNALVLLSVREGLTWKAMDSTVSNTSGIYRFDSVPASALLRYAISVSAAGYVPKSVNNMYADSGVTDTANFLLTSMDTSNSWLLYGTITADSATGAALAGVAVVVIQKSGTEYRYSAITDNQGRYAVTIMDLSRSYQITATLDGYLTKDTTLQISTDSSRVNLVLHHDTATTEIRGGRVEASVRSNLLRVTPNPARTSLSIALLNPAQGRIRVALYGPDGRLVRKLAEGIAPAGINAFNSSVMELPGGVYFIRADMAGQRLTKKVILQR